MNVNNNNRAEDESDDDMRESKIVKKFDAILKEIENSGRTTKAISVKVNGCNINLNPPIIK